jgi:hypothetical protein
MIDVDGGGGKGRKVGEKLDVNKQSDMLAQ